MNPETRTILQLETEDAAKDKEIFHMLTGDEIPPHRAFMKVHAGSVKNLVI